MTNLSVRFIASNCLNKSNRISLIEDIFSVSGVPSPNSLKSTLRYIRDFRCPPAAPTNLSIVSVTEDTISIAWNDNSDNEDGFEVVWTGRRPFSQDDDGSRRLNSPNRENFTLTGLFPNYEYCFRVRAFNAGGDSSQSNEACAKISSESPEPTQGISRVSYFNCHVDRRSIFIWMRDLTTNSSWLQQGSLDAQYQGQSCPANNSPFVLSFENEHRYEVAIVDPGALNCPGNNPQNISCRRVSTRKFRGNPNGPSGPIITIS